MPIRGERGVSLVMALVLTALLAATAMTTVSLVAKSSRISGNHVMGQQAFWLAEAGIEAGQDYLRGLATPPNTLDVLYPYNNVQLGAGTFSVSITPDAANPGNYLKAFTLRGTGTVGSITRTIEVDVTMKTFNNYAYLTDSEGGIIWFTTGDLVEGPLHSNDQISISGSPIFQGKVTSNANSFRQGWWYNPTFVEGYQLGVPKVQLPDISEVLNNFTIVNAGSPTFSKTLTGNTLAEVKFNADGTFTYGEFSTSGGPYTYQSSKTYTYGPITQSVASTNNLIYIDGSVEVSGTINGSVTISATDDILLVDDVRYHDSDAGGVPTASSVDYLGLVAADDIMVVDNAANSTDIVINGAALALGGSFLVQHYWSGAFRGNLTLYGSLSQKTRGPVGTVSWWGKTGYQKNYHFDSRFSAAVPPYYPATGEYKTLSWREVD